jgi:hypothetical protein
MKRKHAVTGTAWAIIWRNHNVLSGESTHLIHVGCVPILFPTRAEARKYIEMAYGYIRRRPDLRRDPHGWRIPKAVRATVEATP